MIMDKLNQVSSLQAVTASAPSTDVIDLGAAYDFGNGEPVFAVTRVGQAAASGGGSATVQIIWEGDTTTAFSSAVTLADTGAIGQAALTANKIVGRQRLSSSTPIRYIRARYVVASGPLTAGTFDAFLVKDVDNYDAYNNGYTVE